MSKIPTAESFFKNCYINDYNDPRAKYKYEEGIATFTKIEIFSAMKNFAKLHVEAALKEASKKSIMRDDNEDCHYEDEEGNFPEYYIIDRNSILNAYPLENIK